MLKPEELLKTFDLAFLKRTTVDKDRCDNTLVGSMYQGLFRVIKDGNKQCAPFMFHDESSLAETRKFVETIQADNFRVSFVQHYLHYKEDAEVKPEPAPMLLDRNVRTSK